nr:zinc-binding dehydrogenase [Bradyrhizobium sp. 6(2017)]
MGVTFRARSIEQIREIFDKVRVDIWPTDAARKLRLVIDQVYKLADIGKAFDHMEADNHRGKIVATLQLVRHRTETFENKALTRRFVRHLLTWSVARMASPSDLGGKQP